MTTNARALRNEATDVERALWRILARYRPRFTRQLVVARYILDLACREAKLAVEFDGSQHQERNAEDNARTAFLESLGWQVIRFWNSEVTENADGVAEAILRAVFARTGTHPRPLPSREGRRKRDA